MYRLILIALLFLLPDLYASGKETFYYASNNRPCSEEEAIIKLEVYDAEKKGRIMDIYAATDEGWELRLHKEISIKGNKMKITVQRDREVVDRYRRKYVESDSGYYSFTEKRRGMLMRTGVSSRFLPLQLEGIETKYYEKGHVKTVGIYKNNQMLSNQNWLFNGRKSHENVYQSVDAAPYYMDGDAKIHEYIRGRIGVSGVPVADLDGTIRINLIILENGKIGAINLISGLREDMDDVVMRSMLNLPGDWEPAVLNGEKVRSSLVFPISFYLGAKGPQSHKPELPGAVLFWW